MATIRRELSTRVSASGESEVLLRVSVRRGLQPRLRTGVMVKRERFAGAAFAMTRNPRENSALIQKQATLAAMEEYLLAQVVAAPATVVSKAWLQGRLDSWRHGMEAPDDGPLGLADAFDEYLRRHALSEVRARNYLVLQRAVRRYVLWRRARHMGDTLLLDQLDAPALEDMEQFFRSEPAVYRKYPEIYKAVPYDTRPGRLSPVAPRMRGDNTVCDMMRRLRAMVNWCRERGLMQGRPFERYSCSTGPERYGTPYYLTVQERRTLEEAPMPSEALAAQRDVFVFQCLVGCRVSDLMRLTEANVIRGAIEYVPDKTRAERPEVVRVPLHARAAAILERWRGRQADGRLLPFISQQRYNDAIRAALTAAGITRRVTVINPTTGLEEQRPINEIASSHMARRTFIGNLYRRVKDPALVGKLSGHAEGSRAFARYRDIDEDIRREVIDLL